MMAVWVVAVGFVIGIGGIRTNPAFAENKAFIPESSIGPNLVVIGCIYEASTVKAAVNGQRIPRQLEAVLGRGTAGTCRSPRYGFDQDRLLGRHSIRVYKLPETGTRGNQAYAHLWVNRYNSFSSSS